MADILQPCVSFNHKNTYRCYRERIYKLEDQGYNPTDKLSAFARAQYWGERIPIGVIYRGERPICKELLPALKEVSLVKQIIDYCHSNRYLVSLRRVRLWIRSMNSVTGK